MFRETFCIGVFNVLAHQELATHTRGLQCDRDTGQEGLGHLWTSAMNCLHWDVGPFLKMEKPQVTHGSGATLESISRYIWAHYYLGIWEHHEGTAPESETGPLLTCMGSFKSDACSDHM